MAIVLENPSLLWIWGFSIFLILLVHFHLKRRKEAEALKFTNVSMLQKLLVRTKKPFKLGELISLALLAFSLLLLSIAAAGLANITLIPTKEHYLVLAVDNSYTMLFEDYRPNRLEATKKALKSFLENIDYTTTKVAIVAFGPTTQLIQNFSKSPDELKRAVDRIEVATLAGTAIGDALVLSSQLIPEGEIGTIILLTDGRNNLGILLENAVETVKRRKIVVYPVGVGSSLPQFAEINKEELAWIASETGGVASFSENDVDLEKAYERITGLILRPRVVAEKTYLTSYLLLGTGVLIIVYFILGRIFSPLP